MSERIIDRSRRDIGFKLDRAMSRNQHSFLSGSTTLAVRITTKGSVTIPQGLRAKFGLLPNTDAEFLETTGGVLIRPVIPKADLIEERLRAARGVADTNLKSDEILQLTRGLDDDTG